MLESSGVNKLIPSDAQKTKRVRVNGTLYASELRKFGEEKALHAGKKLHALISSRSHDRDTYVGNLLIQMYANCGSMDEADLVFRKINKRNIFSFNLMISGYVRNMQNRKALHLFNLMEPTLARDVYTFSTALTACSRLGDLLEGKNVHAWLKSSTLQINTVVENALIDMYGKCGSVQDARDVFEKMERRDLVSWNTMITAYAQNGEYLQALEIYQRMDLKPDEFTYSSVLMACSRTGELRRGEEIHACIEEQVLERSTEVGNAVVNMYGRCGSLVNAEKVFHEMINRNNVSWNAMLGAFAQHGHVHQVVELHRRMELEGMEMSGMTLMSLLRACSHGGKVEQAIQRFGLMQQDHPGLVATQEQYRCMVDMLGRAGWLDEAEELLRKRLPEDSVAWLTLLGSCKLHKDVERGVEATNAVVQLDPGSASPAYVLLSNTFAAGGRWKDVDRIARIMGNEGLEPREKLDVHLRSSLETNLLL